VRKKISISLAQAKFFAGLFTNLAAGWLGVIFIAPTFGGDLLVLTEDVFFCIVCSWLAIKFEERVGK